MHSKKRFRATLVEDRGLLRSQYLASGLPEAIPSDPSAIVACGLFPKVIRIYRDL